ncbi:hypothetical protein S83_044007 [Arachis hypogaea]
MIVLVRAACRQCDYSSTPPSSSSPPSSSAPPHYPQHRSFASPFLCNAVVCPARPWYCLPPRRLVPSLISSYSSSRSSSSTSLILLRWKWTSDILDVFKRK